MIRFLIALTLALSFFATSQAGEPSRVLVFSTNGCPHCETIARELRTLQEKHGWKVGYEATDDFQLIKRESSPSVVRRYRVRLYPTIVLLKGEGEVNRREGAMSAEQLAEFANSGRR